MRLDKYITEKGYAKSRTLSEKLITSGCVKLCGKVITKPSFDVDENVAHDIIVENNEKYVSRGGYKLEGAILNFNIDVKGKSFIDVGASTGGFTDCLLQNGAVSVLSLDSGKGQLADKIKNDVRVTSIEGYNARELKRELGMFDGAVMDVSFISQTLIIPSLTHLIKDDGIFVSLIKPQFEAGRTAVGKGGIVKKASDRYMSAMKVIECAKQNNLMLEGFTRSPIVGGDGNIEYLAYFIKKKEEFSIPDNILGSIENICLLK